MADPTTEIASPAADAPAATPPPETNPAPMTRDEARAILEAVPNALPEGRDPLAQDDDSDPLMSGEDDPLETEEALPQEPAAEVVPDELPAAEELPTDEPTITADSDGRKRINILRKNQDGSFFFSARDRAIMNESAEAGISLADAEKRLFGERQAEAAPTAEADAAPKVKTSSDIKAEITTLRQQRKVAAGAYDRDKEMELTEQIEELTTDFAAASFRETQAEQTAKAQEQTAQSAFAQAEGDSFEEVKTKFPDAWVVGSELNKAVWAEIRRMEEVQPNFKSDPDWPFTLAAKVATRKGILAKAAAAATAKPAAPRLLPAPAQRRATPVPSPGAVSGAIPATDPIAALSKKLADATASGDHTARRAISEEIYKMGRPRAA